MVASGPLVSAEDDRDAATLRAWAALRFRDEELLRKIERLPESDAALVEALARALAEEGYPWTANEIRARWKPARQAS